MIGNNVKAILVLVLTVLIALFSVRMLWDGDPAASRGLELLVPVLCLVLGGHGVGCQRS